MRSVVLGIDCSPLRLGWGIVDLEDGAAIACGMERIDLPHKGWSHQQVAAALRAIDTVHTPGVCEVAFIAVEEPGLPPVSGTKSAYNAGRAVQEAVNACQRRWPHAPICELKPSQWRKLVGLPGNASKADVQMKAGLLLLDVGQDEGCPAQDAADALCVALAGQRFNVETYDRAVERGVA
jgi:Holliday junction resolvasome RuvABC endonuclease subunit